MRTFDPRSPDTPFPGLGMADLAALCRHVASLAEVDRHALARVARQAEEWQRRTARIALAGADASRALAEMALAVGTPGHGPAVHAVGFAVGDWLCANLGFDPAARGER